jgi:hypothetical protein
MRDSGWAPGHRDKLSACMHICKPPAYERQAHACMVSIACGYKRSMGLEIAQAVTPDYSSTGPDTLLSPRQGTSN